MTPWLDPRGGQGSWEPTPQHRSSVTDLAVFLIACGIGTVIFLGVLVVGRAAVCAANDQALVYCPGYVAEVAE